MERAACASARAAPSTSCSVIDYMDRMLNVSRHVQDAHDPHRRPRDLRLLQPAGAREGRLPRRGAPAVLAEDPAREPAAPRGRRLRQGGRHPRAGRLDPADGGEKEISFMPARVLLQDFTGVPCVVDLAAMRDGIVALGGDPEQGQPAAAGRARHRPLGAGRLLRPADALHAERRARVPAQPRALRVPALGPDGVPQLPRRAAGDRHRAPGQHRVPGARRRARRARTAGASRIPTRSSAPTRTRRW